MIGTFNFTVGQEVVVHAAYGSRMYITKVKSISPTGVLTTEDGTKFNENGKERGAKGYYFAQLSATNPDAHRATEAAEKRRTLLLSKITEALRSADLAALKAAATALSIEA